MPTIRRHYRTLLSLAFLAGVAVLGSCAGVDPQATPSVTGTADQLPAACRRDCVTPYGQILGTAAGKVAAYSNCNAKCVVFAPNKENDVYTGIRWQCVEFARRWLLDNKGVVYGDVDTAADIWTKIEVVTRVSDGRQFPLQPHLNGSPEPPQVGDLLIYAKEYLNTGHVAVITAVDPKAGFIEVAEQNFLNQPWPADYSRRIVLVDKDNKYWLLDVYLLGWKHAVL